MGYTNQFVCRKRVSCSFFSCFDQVFVGEGGVLPRHGTVYVSGVLHRQGYVESKTFSVRSVTSHLSCHPHTNRGMATYHITNCFVALLSNSGLSDLYFFHPGHHIFHPPTEYHTGTCFQTPKCYRRVVVSCAVYDSVFRRHRESAA